MASPTPERQPSESTADEPSDLLADTVDDLHEPGEWASGYLLSRPYHVLLAEDDEDMRGLVSAALRADGYVVTEVGDGGELVDRVRRAGSEPLDLVVSDVKLPVRSGIDALDELRRAQIPVPVVLMTAFGDWDLHQLAAELGAHCVIDKPFSLADLRTVVFCALEPVDVDTGERPWGGRPPGGSDV